MSRSFARKKVESAATRFDSSRMMCECSCEANKFSRGSFQQRLRFLQSAWSYFSGEFLCIHPKNDLFQLRGPVY
jgi:hypothetical protein